MWLASQKDDRLIIIPDEYNSFLKTKLRSIGVRWQKNKGYFVTKLSAVAVNFLAKECQEITLSEGLTSMLARQESSELNYTLPNDFMFKTLPFSHQVAVFNWMRERKTAALFLEMGLGKTKILIDVLADKLIKEQINTILLIAPKSILEKEVDEVRQHSPFPASTIVLRGSKQKKLRLLGYKANYYIINFESCWSILEALVAKKFDVVAVDESTRIKTATAQRSKAVFQLGQSAKYRYILSGCPTPKDYVDIFGQYKFLDASIFGRYQTSFKNRYCIFGGFGGYELTGYRNIEELKGLIFTSGIRLTKKECLSLPDKLFVKIPIEMDATQASIYQEMKNKLLVELEGKITTAAQALSKIIRLSQITSGFLHNEDGEYQLIKSNPKIEAVLELLSEAPRDKWVIWTNFVLENKMLTQAIKEKGYSVEGITGEVKETKRAQLFKDFQKKKDPAILVMQVSIGGIGIDLTAANKTIYYSNSYNFEHRIQSEDRLHRIGQDQHVTYYDLLLKNTIDLTVLNCLRKKGNMADMLMKNIKKGGEDDNTEE